LPDMSVIVPFIEAGFVFFLAALPAWPCAALTTLARITFGASLRQEATLSSRIKAGVAAGCPLL